MLRLVTVTPADADILFELVTLSNGPNKPDMLAGFMKVHHFFRSNKDSYVKMTFPKAHHDEMVEMLKQPFMPADAVRLGIPEQHYLNMIERIPALLNTFLNPDLMMDPKFINTPPPDRTYLN